MAKACISLVHQINPSNAQQAALAFAEMGLLQEVITSLAYTPDTPVWKGLDLLPKLLRTKIIDELSRRIWTDIPRHAVYTYPVWEILRVLIARIGISKYLRNQQSSLGNWVCLNLDQQVTKGHLKGLAAIYMFEDVAATTFQAAKQEGIQCLYDLPIPFYRMTRRIMAEEAELFPEISSSIQSIHDPAWKLDRKEQEVQLADHIFVASSISRQSLIEIGTDPKKISVIPYGAPVGTFHPLLRADNKFRAIFVGRVSPRKGVHYLLTAWKELTLLNAELVLVGPNLFPSGWLEQYQDIISYVPSVPHLKLNQYYSTASVFVFPSLVEGFGLVILEAMACGIPVITTPNTGGLDILTDGLEGFIVPIRDVEALKEKLEWCYRNPDELAEMGRAARRKAEQLNWGVYRQKLVNQVQKILIEKSH